MSGSGRELPPLRRLRLLEASLDAELELGPAYLDLTPSTARPQRIEGPLAELLERAERALRYVASGHLAPVIELSHVPLEIRDQLELILGRGEVRGVARGDDYTTFCEAQYRGLWWVESGRSKDDCTALFLEAGDLPGCVRHAAEVHTQRELPEPQSHPSSSPRRLLGEIARLARAPGFRQNRVFSFNSSPLSAPELQWVLDQLGTGPIEMVARGYGAVVVDATRLRRAWWVQHLNPEGEVISEAVEVGDVPDYVRATQEDLEASLDQLSAWSAGRVS